MSDNLPANERPASTPDSTAPRMGGAAWGGLALVGVGIVLLLRQTGLLNFDFNWWALFILVPAFAIYYQAWNLYRQTEQFGRRVRSMLVGGSMMAMVAIMFLFDLSWGTFWPIFLIGGGLMALANSGK